MCSSSSSVPIENENEMFLQANEAIDEVIETQEGRFTSKAWKYFKLVKVGGARLVFVGIGVTVKSTRKLWDIAHVRPYLQTCHKKPSNLEIEGGSEGDDGSQPHYFDQDVSQRELAHAIILGDRLSSFDRFVALSSANARQDRVGYVCRRNFIASNSII
ncbi:hypothetical protein HAX54_021726 [Datura stramonium]|uniref:Uncharacterized protein n=1 Tax=Datura stramonium TaxID=4076 RepID=A0ABS8UTZ4_DATST|nr:hypothetical protein [Datura stramonium]